MTGPVRPGSSVQGDNPAVEPLVVVEDVTKSFGGVRALRGVSLSVRPGEVHALLGENGAGKSTLIKILSGVHRHDAGTIRIGGREAAFSSPAESRAAGVAVVYQDLSLVESLSVADNLLLGREPRNRLGLVKRRQLAAEVADFLQRHNIPLDPSAPVSSLPFAYRQLTEICKALMGDVRILILDEPTSALTSDEEAILFDAIQRVTARGVGVIYVTHRLNEVFRISQRVTVFRDGANAGTFATADADMKKLVAAIVGPGHPGLVADGQQNSPRPAPELATTPVLRLSGVRNDRLNGIDLEVRPGEIHGIAGLIGSGRSEILQTIFGLRPTLTGEICIDGVPAQIRGTWDAISKGIALVPEDRHLQGLVLSHTIESNLALPQLPRLSNRGLVRRGASVRAAREAMKRLAIKAPDPWTVLSNLSGGNQQKVVFAKWSGSRLKVLLLDEPTVGVDVGAREEIYAVIRDAARDGAGILVVSSDLTELLILCDRISIVNDGRIVRTIARGEISNETELHHMFHEAPRAEVA
jgi:ribose transport system ATP-binding protein